MRNPDMLFEGDLPEDWTAIVVQEGSAANEVRVELRRSNKLKLVIVVLYSGDRDEALQRVKARALDFISKQPESTQVLR